MSIELKIKNKHLSAEAKIIRFEENKIKKHAKYVRDKQGHKTSEEVLNTYRSLNLHRRWDVRNENRATYLARAYIKGVQYSKVEYKRNRENEVAFRLYILPRVYAMVVKYDKSLPLRYKKWEKSRCIATDELKHLINVWAGVE